MASKPSRSGLEKGVIRDIAYVSSQERHNWKNPTGIFPDGVDMVRLAAKFKRRKRLAQQGDGMSSPRRIIIDTDPGQDDAVAILLALGSTEIEVVGITAVAGNVPLKLTEKNALKICE